MIPRAFKGLANELLVYLHALTFNMQIYKVIY